MRTLPVPAWEMLLPAQVIPPDKWSAMQNLVYCLIVVGTIVLTLGVVWVIRHFHGDPVISVAAPHQDEIKLIYEETLSAADRVVVRDNQVIEAVRYIPKDPNLITPLQRWRDARREWAGEMAFLESLGKNPTPETFTDASNAETLRRLHGLAQELEASQRGLLRAIRQSIATGTENLPLGTDASS